MFTEEELGKGKEVGETVGEKGESESETERGGESESEKERGGESGMLQRDIPIVSAGGEGVILIMDLSRISQDASS